VGASAEAIARPGLSGLLVNDSRVRHGLGLGRWAMAICFALLATRSRSPSIYSQEDKGKSVSGYAYTRGQSNLAELRAKLQIL